MNRPLRPQIVALSALALGVAATLLAWFIAARQADRVAKVEFDNHASLAANLLDRRLQRYIDVLYGLEALAYHETNLSRVEFSRYAAALEIHRRFTGLNAVEFVRRVKGPDREAFIASVRNDRSAPPADLRNFDVRPAGDRNEYWVVDFVEPYAGNEKVFGLDILTREGARNAAERARDTGEATSTGRYRLAQERSTSYGLVLYLPVYAPGPFLTREDRREALRGFVNVVLRVDDIFGDMLSEPILRAVRMRIHDIGPAGETPLEPSNDTLFFQTQVPVGNDSSSWLHSRNAVDRPLNMAGRQWLVQFEEEPTLSPWLQPFPLLVLGAGLAMSMLLFAVFLAVARTRSEAVALATKATRELRSQLSFTQQLIEALPNAVFYKDREGRYIGCNRAFEDYLGMPRESVIGKRYRDIAPTDLAERSDQADEELLRDAGAVAYESRGVGQGDRAKREVLVNKATFLDPNGEVAGLVGSLVDITQRKDLERNTRSSIELLRAVIQAAPVAIIARDMDRIISMWNPAAERMFGWKESEVLGTNTSIVPPGLIEEASHYRKLAQGGETHLEIETQRMHRDGHFIDVSLSAAPIFGGDGKVAGTMVTIADLTIRKQTEAALRESESQLRLAMDAAQLGMWYWECDSDRFTYSEGLNVLFGRPAESSLANYRDLRERIHEDDRDLVSATIRHAVKQAEAFTADFRVVWPDGSVHWLANRGQVHRSPDGRAQRLIGVAMNITERKIAEQRVAHMAHHDALTGLPNRVLLRDRIQQAIAQAHRNGTQLAVLFLDLDRFKTINDSLGHQLGDRLLQSVASRILVCVREGDTVSRVGGDEFVIVIPGIGSASDGSSVAGKILEVLASAFHLHGNDLHVAASIGISLYPADGSDAETLMRNADTAMYHAKDSGRGNFQFFTQHMNVAAQQRLNLENALRRALEAREFELHYQPLFDLRDRTVTGFEALLRWHPPGSEGVVLPGEFITVAEDSGLIIPIGEWVLREALRHAKSWQSPGRPLTISINVSANQLSRSVFVDRLRRLVNEFGIDPKLIELEVTERVIIEGAGDAREALDELAELGVGIAIDDFGTGYSGL
ncbi:MAG TPA: diguanylate cyclase, partial [Usitatibacter sp.]